jgi:putative hydrolase of the HAD superfamily
MDRIKAKEVIHLTIKAVAFDLFETLVTHLDPNFDPSRPSLAQRLNIPQDLFRVRWSAIEEDWERGKVTDYHSALGLVCRKTGVSFENDVADELADELRARLATIFSSVLPEISTMLADLKGMGLKLGVITNAHDLDTEPFERSELASYFDILVSSYEVGVRKPDQEIYEIAIEKFELAPSEICFVGDGGFNELEGARRVGMNPIWGTWYLDRWPSAITPNPYKGGEWRDRPRTADLRYPLIDDPAMLPDYLRMRFGI